MEENVEFEEGESCYNGNSLDPDMALSRIDEKVQRVLGHFQKDFEGGVSAENLGAKFGGYGSFLPTYERCSSSLSDPKTRQRDGVSKSLTELPSEGVSQKPKTPSKDPPYVRHGAASTHDCYKFPLKDKITTKTGNLSEPSSLKFRIKLSSNKFVHKNAAIYSGLGLGDSPSLLSCSSADQSAGMPPPTPQEDVAESPTEILQVMTSKLVPGGVLVSPLHDSLLCFSTKEKICRGRRFVKEEGKLLKEKKNKPESVRKKLVELENCGKNINSENDKKNLMADILPDKFECAPLSKSKCDRLNSTEEICAVTDVSKSRDTIQCLELMKGDSSGSRSCQDSNKNDKQSSSSTLAEKDSAQNLAIFNNDNLVHKDGSKREGGKAYAMLNDFSDAVNAKKHSDPQKQKLSQKVTGDGNNTLYDRVKITAKGKNRINESCGNDEGSRVNSGGSLNNKSGDKKSKIYKFKSRCPVQEGNHYRDSIGDISLKQNGVNKGMTEGVSGQLSKGAKFNNCQIEQPVFRDKPNERSSIKKVGTSRDEVSVKDAQNAVVRDFTNALTPQVECNGADADLNDDWVMCDRCQKWRLLPFETKPEDLPEKWLCSMLNWLPGMNCCDISEEETTNARNALYCIPVSVRDKTTSNHVDGTAPDLSHLHGSDHKLTSETIGSQEKKKQSSKVTQQGSDWNGVFRFSNSAKDSIRDSLKRKSLDDTTHAVSNSIKDSNAQQMNKLTEKLNLLNEGDTRQLKKKSKGVADRFGLGSGTSKKSKANDDYSIDKHQYNEGKSTTTSFPNTAHGKSMQKKNRVDSPEGAKYGATDKLLVSLKKLGGHTKAISDCRSIDSKLSDEKESSLKKKSLKEWQDDQNCQTSIGSINGEKLSECVKSLLSNNKRKLFSANNPDDKPMKKGRVMLFKVSCYGDRVDDGTDKVRNVCKDQKAKLGNKALPTEPLKRDLGSEVSKTAVSSSSKVACSRKKFEVYEVKGSPVGSVSSSPLGTIHPDQARRSEKRLLTDLHHESNNVLLLKHGDADTENFCWKVGTTFEVQNAYLFSDEANSVKAKEPCYKEDNVQNDVSISNAKAYEDRNSSTYVHLKIVKANDPDGNHSRKKSKYEHDAITNHDILVSEIVKDKQTTPQKHTANFSRKEENQIGKRSSEVQLLGDNKLQSQRKLKQHGRSDMRLGVLSTANGIINLQEKLNPNFKDVNESNSLPVASEKRKSKLLLLSEKAGLTADACSHTAERRTSITSEFSHLDNGVCRVNSSSLAANDILEKAKELREYADHLKSSGFDFESNEAYFQAALKFLHGASLLDTCKIGNDKHGERIQIQVYNDAATLCENCGNEYEKRKEMALAALAYKCVEVAHMRLIFCKHSSTNKDRQELQVALQTIPQGESPSSSASDVDNLSNQMNRPTLSESNGSLFSGSHVISAQTRPSIIRLLDFTQNVNLAMEALTKSHNALAAADATAAEDAKNKDNLTFVKRIIDFSFQNVEEFSQLVSQAMEAINRSSFVGNRC